MWGLAGKLGWMWSGRPSGCLGVSWVRKRRKIGQVCDEKHPGPVPDLIRIAEMDEDRLFVKAVLFRRPGVKN